MQYSPKNLPPSIAHYAALSQERQHPIQNVFVPDKRAMRRFRSIIAFYDNLPKSEPFNYGTGGSQPEPPPSTEKPIEFDQINDLPLFEKR